ncbi:MAG: CoA-binding protein, partial [Alphaproteobacteria bacterium]|nr:CoA-binding protein [Alphaproteobacteria bacterium]
MTVARDVYTARELGRMFRPRSVAVVGASPTPGNFGQRTIDNLRHFAGPVYAVNPKYDRVGDKPCFASLADLPEAPDCVVLTVPRMGVEPLVEEAAAIGAGGIVVYASGYAETAREDREREQERLAAIAKAGRLPLMGPNCLGIVNHATRCGMTFMVDYHATPDLVGPIGVASQSGALGYLVVQAPHRGMGFSFFLASGNSCDIDICDLASFLVDDPATRSIVLILEGIKSGERFFQMAERARAADKALIIHKATRGAVSRRAAHRHTGTIAGEDAAYRAAFARAGAVVVEEHEAVLETASFFAKAPRPSGKGPAIVATSGGAGVIAATKAEEAGVHLPRPD